MKLQEAAAEIEEILSESSNLELLKICNTFFDEESFGDDINDGIIDDMFNILVNTSSSDKILAENIYYYLTDEKIIIDEEKFYLEEELEYE